MPYRKTVSGGSTNSVLNPTIIWQYRSLLWVFVISDLKSRYTETFLGLFWAIIQPLTGLLIFTIFFDRVLQLDTGNMPYPVFALSGMSAWYYFVFIVNNAGTSLIQMQNIVKKVRFPRILCPLSKTLSGLADLGLSILLLEIIMISYGHPLTIRIIFIPFVLLLLILTGLAIGLWVSALTVRYRDLLHVVPYLISFAIWITPVFYPVTILPEKYIFIMYLNPMAAIIEGFRWSLSGSEFPDFRYLVSLIPVILIFISGLIYFLRSEGKVSEIL